MINIILIYPWTTKVLLLCNKVIPQASLLASQPYQRERERESGGGAGQGLLIQHSPRTQCTNFPFVDHIVKGKGKKKTTQKILDLLPII